MNIKTRIEQIHTKFQQLLELYERLSCSNERNASGLAFFVLTRDEEMAQMTPRLQKVIDWQELPPEKRRPQRRRIARILNKFERQLDEVIERTQKMLDGCDK
jgi:hypothetical protein